MGIALAISLLTTFSTLQRFDTVVQARKQADLTQKNTAIYRHQMLAFCYDNNVHPCDDKAVENWNKANPANEFKLLTPSQLQDESNRLEY